MTFCTSFFKNIYIFGDSSENYTSLDLDDALKSLLQILKIFVTHLEYILLFEGTPYFVSNI